MKIIEVDIKRLNEYGKNPRRNEKAVQYVINSIKMFGFLVPIVIDKDYTIVCGHTRYKALKKLNYDKVPCVVAEGLTDDEINAFRIADNKVAEKSNWNIKLLQEEIRLLPKFNFSNFGFDFDVVGNKPNQRNRTIENYNIDYFDDEQAKNKYGIPELEKCNKIPSRLIGFNEVKTAKEFDSGVHFYIDDYQFERIWNNPEKYIPLLNKFECVFTPDFSLYDNFPLALMIWNTYRSRMIGQILQQNNIDVIPTISWGDDRSYEFCFDGIPVKSTVSISTIGIKKDTRRYQVFKDGFIEMIKRLKPLNIIVYGGKVDVLNDYSKNINFIYFENKRGVK